MNVQRMEDGDAADVREADEADRLRIWADLVIGGRPHGGITQVVLHLRIHRRTARRLIHDSTTFETLHLRVQPSGPSLSATGNRRRSPVSPLHTPRRQSCSQSAP